MDVREKLVELMKEVKYSVFPNSTDHYTFGVQHSDHIFRQVADHLIANGVTVQDNTEITYELFKQLRTAPLTVLHEEPTIEVVQEWISVKDRLPEDSTYVLARLSGGATYEALCLTKGSKQWCAINREPFVNKDTVTHWMPMPEPPKEAD